MTTEFRTLIAAIIVALASVGSHAVTTGTTTEIEKQATQLNTMAENKGQAQVATKIASSFGSLAGSDANTLKLVQSLRNGTAVTLTTSTMGTGSNAPADTTTTVTPPTGKMGWGNVFTSLALAKDALARAGITDPTTAQLQAALTGGDIVGADGKTVTLKGILQMRADGMGWGQIAQASGTKLGPVVSSIKSTHAKVASLPATSATSTGATTPAAITGAGPSASKGVTTAAGTSGVSGGHASKGIMTASGASAGTVTAAGGSGHGNSANAPGRGVVTAAGGGASAAGVSNGAGGNGKGNSGGGGNAKGKPGG